MRAENCPAELEGLRQAIAACSIDDPAAARQLHAAFASVTEMVRRRQRIMGLVQEALSQLRLDVKYLMFDLEVTRRERDQYRGRLEETERGY